MVLKSYITAPVSAWNYDMGALPFGAKCFLLNEGGVAVVGSVTANTRKDFMAWAPMPKRDKELEKRLREQKR